jgi:leucyl aminopeptidase
MYVKLCLLLSALSFAIPALAAPAEITQQDSDWRLIQTGPNVKPKWMNQDDIDKLHLSRTKFMDITFTRNLAKKAPVVKKHHRLLEVPNTLTQQTLVNSIVAGRNTDLMKAVLTPLSKYFTRYYTTDTGRQSSEWLMGQIQDVVTKNNPKGLKVTVTPFKHSWVQSSIIARIEGLNGNQETVIAGGHQDSINQSNPRKGRAPGADDDGSGAVTLLESLRLLLVSGYQPLRPVEFHWYAGEEAGLLGSQAIAQQYQNDNRLVAGMLQLDMTSFPNPDKPDIGIVTDNVDDGLTSLLRTMVTTYTPLTSGDFECGYACSDHASWNQAGYASVIPFESSNMEQNFGNMHTPNDDINTVNFDHALNFVNLVVAFVVELSHQ